MDAKASIFSGETFSDAELAFPGNSAVVVAAEQYGQNGSPVRRAHSRQIRFMNASYWPTHQ
jgi:hypothetical protein